LLRYNQTPIQELIGYRALERAGVRILVKREDLNHPYVSGNKWWKLKYNLEAAIIARHHKILTFGGAFSNHIHATAAAAKEMNLKAIGIIRGEETLPLNPTLRFAVENGMELSYVNRAAYRKKNTREFFDEIHEQFGDFYLIPEGGSNLLAVKGCAEFATKELMPIDFDHLLLPVGTGGTLAGLICGLEGRKNIFGVPVLKGGGFLEKDVEMMVRDFSGTTFGNWSLLTEYHHGGYAKVTNELLAFMQEIKNAHNLPLDHVYTGKLFYAVIKEVEAGSFARGSTLLVLHTGGLQGAVQSI